MKRTPPSCVLWACTPRRRCRCVRSTRDQVLQLVQVDPRDGRTAAGAHLATAAARLAQLVDLEAVANEDSAGAEGRSPASHRCLHIIAQSQSALGASAQGAARGALPHEALGQLLDTMRLVADMFGDLRAPPACLADAAAQLQALYARARECVGAELAARMRAAREAADRAKFAEFARHMDYGARVCGQCAAHLEESARAALEQTAGYPPRVVRPQVEAVLKVFGTGALVEVDEDKWMVRWTQHVPEVQRVLRLLHAIAEAPGIGRHLRLDEFEGLREAVTGQCAAFFRNSSDALHAMTAADIVQSTTWVHHRLTLLVAFREVARHPGDGRGVHCRRL